MASTATTRLRLEKQALGENSATWGAPKLNDVFDRLDEAIGGVASIAISGTTTTLTSTNYATDEARKACLVLTGTLSAASSVIVPNAEKVYLVVNNCTMGAYTLTIKTAAGAGVSLKTGAQWVYCNATSVFTASPRLDQLAAAGGTIDMGGYRVTNSATPTATTDLATKAYVDSVAVTVDASAAVTALQASVDAAIATLAPKASPTFTSAATLSTGVFTVPLGAVGSPSYTFAGDTNTGIYSSGADSVSLVAGGTARATASSSGLGVTGALTTSGAASIGTTLGVSGAATFGSTVAVTGALTAASVASSGAVSGTTLAASGAATLSSTLAVTSNATVGGTLGVTGAITATAGMTAAAPVLTAAGSVSAPSHSFSGDTNSGLYSGGADIVGIVTGGTARLTVDASGNVGVGQTPISAAGYTNISAKGTTGAVIDLTDTLGTQFGRFFVDSTDGHFRWQNARAAGDLILAAGSGAERARITAGGNLLVGQPSVTTPGYSGDTTVGFAIRGDGRLFGSAASFSSLNLNADGAVLLLNRSGTNVGSITVTTTTTAYNTSSDYRLKTNVEPLTGAVTRLAALKPSRFRFKTQAANAAKIDGFLAHEVTPVVPEAVTGTKDGATMQQLDLSKLVPILVAAVQELAVRLEAAEAALPPGKTK